MQALSLRKLEFDKIRASLLEEVKTIPGRQRIEALSPYFDFITVKEEIAKVKEAQRLIAERGYFALPALDVLSPLLQKASRGQFLRPFEIHLIREYILTGKALRLHIKGLPVPRLKSLVGKIGRFQGLLDRIDQVIEKDGADIKDEASGLLLSLRNKILNTKQALKQRLKEILQEGSRAGWLQEELITTRRGRYVVPVRVEAKNRVHGILHDVSASGATLYIEPSTIVPIANKIEALRLEEEQEVVRILKRLTKEILSFHEELTILEDIIAEIDVLQARIIFGEKISGTLPKITRNGQIRLFQAAHPLLLLSGREVVRNDFCFPSDKPVVVISGPNLGGKTVALKTVGLLCLMTQAAIPIPASPDSSLPIFEEILVDIGDEQDLSMDESTFSAHVRRLKEILARASPGRLFLIDEIGRGTDPVEGAALAMAILEHLIGTGAKILATTHYEALKAFSFSRSEILPISVSFDERTGEPTYRLIYGVSGLSLGISLARRLGFPQEIIRQAEQFLTQGDKRFEQVLEALRLSMERLEAERKSLTIKEKELEEERGRLAREIAKLKAEFQEKEVKLFSEYKKRMCEIEREFKDLTEKLSAQRIGLQRAKERFSRFLYERSKSALPSTSSSGPILPGARVRVKGLGQEGRILRVKGEFAEVQLGPFKLEVILKDLVLLPDEGRLEDRGSFSLHVKTDVPATINLVGLRVDEALEVLDKFIDRAFLSGKSRLTVIHGLGTGRLMRAVREYLTNHTQVVHVRAGNIYEGGEAVTIVDLANGEGRV